MSRIPESLLLMSRLERIVVVGLSLILPVLVIFVQSAWAVAFHYRDYQVILYEPFDLIVVGFVIGEAIITFILLLVSWKVPARRILVLLGCFAVWTFIAFVVLTPMPYKSISTPWPNNQIGCKLLAPVSQD
jgi:peptidoglycan/LPS O-acetylase OafA/YrhL